MLLCSIAVLLVVDGRFGTPECVLFLVFCTKAADAVVSFACIDALFLPAFDMRILLYFWSSMYL